MLERLTKRKGGLLAGSAVVALCATTAAGCSSSSLGMHDPRIEIATCNTSPSTVREYYDPNPAADRANWVSFAFRDEGTSTSQVYVHMQNGKYDGRTVAAGTKLDDIADGAAAIVAGEDVNGIWEHSATSFTLFCYDGVNLIKHPSDISTAHVEHINWNTVTE